MDDANTRLVRRIAVSDAIAARDGYDYADAFELQLDTPDDCTPEAWVRAGVDAVPAWIKRLANAPDGLAGVRAARSDDDVVVFEQGDSVMDTVLVGRNAGPGRRVFTTILRFRRPWLARAVWNVVGPVHRRVAPTVVAGGIR